MSLKEIGTKQPADGVKRSSSFAGGEFMFGSTTSLASLEPLGSGLRSKMRHSSGSKSRMPKVPRPGRASVMFKAIADGIREYIFVTQQDIDSLQHSEEDDTSIASGMQARHLECRKRLKAAERYKKRLEFHLAKVEELSDCYQIQSQLRDGVRTMAQAYAQSPGKQRESLHSVKCGYRECTQTMCAIEAQLEELMGTFQCKMKGMVGFARVCPGDVFDVSIRHGAQKWKSRGKVAKMGGQSWSHDTQTFKALLGNVFAIKVVESRSLKSVVLGEKCCETKDLFSAQPQLMTVNVNASGTLKLSFIVNWNPLDGCEEKMTYFEPPQRSQVSSSSRRAISMYLEQSPISEVDGTGHANNKSRPFSFHSGLLYDPTAENSGRLRTKSAENINKIVNRPNGDSDHRLSMKSSTSSEGLYTTVSNDSSAVAESTKGHLLKMRMLADSIDTSESRDDVLSLEEALNNLRTTLEDYQGHYTELRQLEEQIQRLNELVLKSSELDESSTDPVGTSYDDATLTRSIETVIDAFDFLDTVETEEGEECRPQSPPADSDGLASLVRSPESTAKTADSGIESLANQLSEDGGNDSSVDSGGEHITTGNEQVDQALLHHLCYCDRLMESLGNFGPLKCREIYSLDNLQQQADMIKQLIDLAEEGPYIVDIHKVMSSLTSDKSLKEFWTKCIDGSSLCVNTERFLAQLEREFGDLIRERYDTGATKVLRAVVAKFLDIRVFDPEKAGSHNEITLYQFMGYLQSCERELHNFVDEVAAEVWLCGRLRSCNVDIVIKTLLTFTRTVPPTECLKLIPLLLLSDSADVRVTAETYLRDLVTEAEIRKKVLVTFVEGLEDSNADIRCGACIALRELKAVEAVDQLVFICETDNSSTVRSRAKEALLVLGEEGKEAISIAELGLHGFQGLSVYK